MRVFSHFSCSCLWVLAQNAAQTWMFGVFNLEPLSLGMAALDTRPCWNHEAGQAKANAVGDTSYALGINSEDVLHECCLAQDSWDGAREPG